MELIKIEERDGNKTVNARDLWNFLESGQDFSHWITGRVANYNFTDGEDFTIILTKSNGGRPSKEYHISVGMAKELSMVERNEKGKQARQYFIECEKKVSETQLMTPAEMMLKNAQLMVDQEKKLAEINTRLDIVEAKQITKQENYFTVSGYCSLNRVQVSKIQAADLGRKCSKLSRERDYIIDSVPDEKYGRINSYHTDILKEIVC